MLVNLLNICSDDELTTTEADDQEITEAIKAQMTEEQIAEYQSKRQSEKAKLQKKIRGIGRMARHFQQLREESEKNIQLKGLAGSDAAVNRSSLGNFDDVKNFDKINEKMPTRRPPAWPSLLYTINTSQYIVILIETVFYWTFLMIQAFLNGQ